MVTTPLDAWLVGIGDSMELWFEDLKKKKDACYRKVRSRYTKWPSAYASGALVQCRKVGAANWGNSKKKALTKVARSFHSPAFCSSVVLRMALTCFQLLF